MFSEGSVHKVYDDPPIGSVCPHLDVPFKQSKLCEILKNQYSTQSTEMNHETAIYLKQQQQQQQLNFGRK